MLLLVQCGYVYIVSSAVHVLVIVMMVCMCYFIVSFFFFQAEDGIRDAQESRGLGDVYKRQELQYGQGVMRRHFGPFLLLLNSKRKK